MFPGAFCFQGKDKSFSIFTGSLLREPENLSSQINRDYVRAPTLVPEVFFSLGATELSGEAASREAVRKKPLVPTDNNLTSMPTPISFD